MDLGLTELLRYSAWANRTLLDACRELTDEQLDARLPATSGPVRELLMHIIGGQQAYIEMTNGRAEAHGLDRESAWPGMPQLIALAELTSQELVSIAEHLDPDSEVDLSHHGKLHRYPRRFLLTNAVEHGIRHRTEVALNLASIGVAPPDLDGWAYGRSAGYGAEAQRAGGAQDTP